MFKKKKGKKAKEVEGVDPTTVADLGLEFSESDDEEEADAGPAVPRESVAATPALWSGNLAFCGALPVSTWPNGTPQKRGPLTARGATRWFVLAASAIKVYKNSSMAGKPQVFNLEGGSMSLGLAAGQDSYLVLPSAGPGMVLYFRPTVIVEEKKTMSAGEKKAMMEAQAAKMKAQAAANDPYPGLPSMDGMGRNKKHKDYGKGDPEIQDKVKKIKKAKKAAAAAAAADAPPEPEPEPTPEPTAEEGEPPEGPNLNWESMVEITLALAQLSVAVAQPEEESNPLLADFEPDEVKYTHHAPEPESPDSSDSDPDDEEPEDPGPQIKLAQGSEGAIVTKYGPKAAKCKGMRAGVVLKTVNGKSVMYWPVDMVKSVLKTEARPMDLVFLTQPDDEEGGDC